MKITIQNLGNKGNAQSSDPKKISESYSSLAFPPKEFRRGARLSPYSPFRQVAQKVRTYTRIFQASSSLMGLGIIETISVPGLPFLMTQKSSPSVLCA